MLTATETQAPPSRQTNYRPHLDGLRAIAVLLVVAFHSEIGALSGGFVGVDVFFVLSGYLVTRLLLRDLDLVGRVRLSRFYARRYRRLLPAAFVMLTVTAATYVVVASAAEVADSVAAFKASFLYYANWYFIHQSADYFAADINRSPVIHFWSLAVEEQFYLLWPLLLGGIVTLTRRFAHRQLHATRWIVAVLALASAAAALHISGSDLNRAYYGTDTRGYQLLAGALLALTPKLFSMTQHTIRHLGAVGFAAIGTIVLVSTSAWDADAIHRGIVTTVATCVLIVAIENAPSATVTRSLSNGALTYLGRLSYGIYLWHWPVIVVLVHETTLGSVALFAVTCTVATTLAALSYHLLELRVRLSRTLDRYSMPVIGAGLTLSLLGGLVVAPAILHSKHGSELQVTGPGGVDVHTLDWQAAKRDIPPLPECSLAESASCTIVSGSGPHVLLLGDSNARMYIPTFQQIAVKENLTLSVAAAPLCPWQRDLSYLTTGIDSCRARHADWYGGLIDRLDPDIIVVVDRPIDDPVNSPPIVTPNGDEQPGSPQFENALTSLSAASLDQLRAVGRTIVIIEPIPIPAAADDPLECLSSATSLDQCAYQATPGPTPLEAFYRRAAQATDVRSIDFDRLVCPRLPTCDPVVDGLIVKANSSHLTGTFAAHLATQVDTLLRGAGVLP